MIRDIINGFFMALADSVPGVSSGTVAFIMGFYDKFLSALNDLIYADMNKKKEAFKYLIKLGIGWAIGMIMAVLVLSSLFEKKIYMISSLFVGFIAGAIPLIIIEEKENLKNVLKNIIFLILGTAVVVLLTYLNKISIFGTVDLNTFSIGLAIRLFVIGAIAISAMFLPGISGSTLLLIFGVYMPLINAIKELLHFNLKSLPNVIILGLGIILGVLTVVKLIKTCLEKHRPQTIYFILGMMIGSFYAIIMGPTTLDVPLAAMSLKTFEIIPCILGLGLILLLQKLKDVK